MNKENEEWKDIRGFENRYRVSNFGEVLSLNFKNTGKVKLLKPICRANGQFVMLSDYKLHAVHDLVAKNFVIGYAIDKIVNHKDGNIRNNHADNLEWVNQSLFVDLNGELWRDIKGYEGLYQVSNMGRVRSFHSWKDSKEVRLRKIIYDGKKTRIPSVLLKKGGKSTMWWVCKLVAFTFLDDYKEGYQIIHKDGDEQNNRSENLLCSPCDIDKRNEEWRDIVGYEGLYQVSNLGRVRSLNYRKRKEHRLMKPVYSKRNGYYDVVLSKHKKCQHHKVHKLVAMAFVPGYREGLFVNHKDENKLNNQAENLEWITQSANNAYGTARERQANAIHLLLSKPVERVDEEGKVLESYKSQSAAARAHGLNTSRIATYCKKGIYGWRYKGDSSITCPRQARYVIPAEEDNSIEEWRDIKGYEGLYMVSSKGRIKSLPRNRICSKAGHLYMTKESILKGTTRHNGYQVVSLCKDGNENHFQVHRLVALTFLVKPDAQHDIVNHINENPSDNRVINLEWCTTKENLNYGTCNQRQGESRRQNGIERKVLAKRNKLELYGAEKPVICIDDDGCIINSFRSISDAARSLKISSSHIISCCKGKRNSAGGYKWVYDK